MMGPKGGLRIAHGYKDGGTEPHFHDYKNGYGYIDPKHVYAWAEIPPFGSDDTCHIVSDGYGWWECDECGCSIDWDDPMEPPGCSYCPSCGRKVIEDVQQEP